MKLIICQNSNLQNSKDAKLRPCGRGGFDQFRNEMSDSEILRTVNNTALFRTRHCLRWIEVSIA